MKLTLHIGMPRAGGIAISNYLHSLGESVGPFETIDGPADLMMLGATPPAFKEYSRRYGAVTSERIDALRHKLRSAKTDHVVISSAILYDFSESQFIGNLCLELDAIFDEMQVVIYFQHQVDDFPELVTQRVKAGMKDWSHVQAIPDELYQYDNICELWDQDIDLIVRDYGRCEDDVVGDFCSVAGLSKPQLDVPSPQAPLLDADALKLMHLINACADPAKDRLRRRVVTELERLTLSEQAFTIEDTLANELAEQFAQGNQRVSNEYLSGEPLLREADQAKFLVPDIL